MEYIKDYDFSIKYHLGKVNVVADGLSRKSGSMASLRGLGIIQQFEDLGVEFQPLRQGVMCHAPEPGPYNGPTSRGVKL